MIYRDCIRIIEKNGENENNLSKISVFLRKTTTPVILSLYFLSYFMIKKDTIVAYTNGEIQPTDIAQRQEKLL